MPTEAVGPDSARKGASIWLFAGAGAASGALTTPLLTLLGRAGGISDTMVGSVPMNLTLAGAAFGVALAGALIWEFRFQARRLLILVAVLAGWHLALEVFFQREAAPPMALDGTQTQYQLDPQCEALDAGRLPSPDPELKRSCVELGLVKMHAELSSFRDFWNSLFTHGLSGAIGAFVTVLGVPLATGRRFPVAGIGAATVTGIAVAMVFVVAILAIPVLRFAELDALFIPWQAAVAGIIGRYLR